MFDTIGNITYYLITNFKYILSIGLIPAILILLQMRQTKKAMIQKDRELDQKDKELARTGGANKFLEMSQEASIKSQARRSEKEKEIRRKARGLFHEAYRLMQSKKSNKGNSDKLQEVLDKLIICMRTDFGIIFMFNKKNEDVTSLIRLLEKEFDFIRNNINIIISMAWASNNKFKKGSREENFEYSIVEIIKKLAKKASITLD